ncbi:LuxR C-terminal-related transcriptional regulator [Streptomyces sp. 21So2-11]|uniref:LuxR C-terminal-related transcriptional regulator n=1 Tax=Streptomyces sp. 21So2-11 TaxID=3144408 RepID=UPI00321A1CAF
MATAIVALEHGGQAERAERWCRRLISLAEQRGAVTWRAMLQSVGARIALRRGDSEQAVEQARTALGSLDNAGWGIAVSQPLTVLLLANTARGAYDEAAEALDHSVPQAMFKTAGGLQYMWARGRYHMATGRFLAAVSDFEQCRTLSVEWGMDSYILASWQGDLKRANAQLSYSTIISMPQRGSGEERVATDGSSTGHATGPGLRIPGQRGCSSSQPIPADTPQTAAPAAWGATQLLTPPSTETVAETSSALSDAEQRVAQLAVKGRTNRQIASILFITVSTVEQHLTRVYRKLGVKGRSDLPPELDTLALEHEKPRSFAHEAYCAEISTRLA